MMKKKMYKRLLIVVILLSTVLHVAAQEPYAVFNNGTLTFYYDGNKTNRGGISVGPFTSDFQWNNYSSQITTVVFDPSFADCHTITSTAYWFYYCIRLKTIKGIEYLNTENVTDMNNMFNFCYSLESLDVSRFNTSNVTNMSYMFKECSLLTTLDISGFDTRKVTDMSGMFMACDGLTTLDLSHFDTSNVTDMKSMFSGSDCLISLDLRSFNTSKVTNMSSMFWQCFALESLDVSSFDTRNVTSMASMFIHCRSLKSLDVSNFDTGNVTDMSSMFSNCSSLTSLDLSNFNTVNVRNMGSMFSGLGLTTLDLTHFDTWKVTNMYAMFYGCSSLSTIYCNETWRASTSSQRMFNECTSLPNFNSDKVDASYAKPVADGGYFTQKGEYNPEPYAVFDNGTLTFYYNGFKESHGGYSLKPFDSGDIRWDGHAIDISKVVFDVLFANFTTLTSTAYWFCNCKNLTTITGIENLKTSNVTDMTGMFKNCSSLSQLDVNGFDVSKVTAFNEMFKGCTRLSTISSDAGWAESSASSDNMFSGCSSLPGYNMSKTDVTYAKSVADEGYFMTIAESQPKEPYAVFSEGTLTFYYDNKKIERNGYRVGPFTSTGTAWGGIRDQLTKVVFDKSFADCNSITSLEYWFCYCYRLESIEGLEYLNTSKVVNMGALFWDCRKLRSVDLSSFNTDNVISMGSMFAGCSSLTTLDLSNFKTDKVQNMMYMFDGCTNLTTVYVGSGWVISASDIYYSGRDMLRDCTNLVGGAGTVYNESYTDQSYARIDKNGQPGYFTAKSTASVQPYAVYNDGVLTFYYDENKASRGGYDVGGNTIGWLEHSKNITTVVFSSSFARYTNITSMASWFDDCTNLTTFRGMCNFNTGNVTNMHSMFRNCKALKSIDLSHFDTGRVQNMQYMFAGCSGLTKIDVTGFNTSNVLYFDYMFYQCQALASLDLTHFSMKNAQMASRMFSACNNLETIWCNDTWALPYTAQFMFTGCSGLYGYSEDNTNDNTFAKPIPIGGYFTPEGWMAPEEGGEEPYAVYDNGTLTFYYDGNKESRGGMSIEPFTDHLNVPWANMASSVTTAVVDGSFANNIGITSTAYWFYNCTKLTSVLGLQYLKTDNVKDMSYMFMNCNALTDLDVTGFKMDNVTNMSRMFYGCSSLTNLDLSGFILDNVTSNLESLFYNCSSLTNLDVSAFKTDNITDMSSMFYGCSALTSLDISGFNTAKIMKMNSMFEGCSGLTSLDLSSFNTTHVTEMDRMFYGCVALTTILVDEEKWSTDAVTSGNSMFDNCTNLVGGRGTVYDGELVDVTYARIDKYGQPGYLKDIDSLNDPEAYAVVKGKTVTFYYDSKKAKRGGSDINDRRNNAAYWNATKAIFDVSFVDYRPTSTAYWFYTCRYLTTITGMEYLNTEDVTNMAYMFNECEALNDFDVSGFNTKNVTNMEYMFSDCRALTNLDVSNFNTENVENMNYMFYFCRFLTNLDLCNFNTAKVTKMGSMFKYCFNLATIYCNDAWSSSYSYGMFDNCSALIGAIVYDASKTDVTYANPTTGYFTPKNVGPTKCAKPVIHYAYGELSFSCETEGVEYVYSYSSPEVSVSETVGNNVELPRTYTVTVFARKEGMEDSEKVTQDIDVSDGLKGDVDGDGVVDIADAVRIVNFIVGKIPALAPCIPNNLPDPE